MLLSQMSLSAELLTEVGSSVVRWPNFDEVDDSSYFQQLGKQYRSTPPRFRSNLPEWPGFLGPQEPRLGTRQNPVVVDVDHDSQRYGRSITPEPRSRSSRDASPLSTGRIFDIHATTRTIWQRIAACARKPLFARDSKPGYIYVYTVPGNTDFVKIGFTTKRVRNRMQEWSRGCNRDPILLYPPKDIPEELIPHAQRVEALIHAELRPHRVAFFCESCRVEHNEWFRIPAEHAITVVRKWSDWMKATPYLPGVGMYAPFLSLRAVWRRKFADPEGYLKMASLTVI